MNKNLIPLIAVASASLIGNRTGMSDMSTFALKPDPGLQRKPPSPASQYIRGGGRHQNRDYIIPSRKRKHGQAINDKNWRNI